MEASLHLDWWEINISGDASDSALCPPGLPMIYHCPLVGTSFLTLVICYQIWSLVRVIDIHCGVNGYTPHFAVLAHTHLPVLVHVCWTQSIPNRKCQVGISNSVYSGLRYLMPDPNISKGVVSSCTRLHWTEMGQGRLILIVTSINIYGSGYHFISSLTITVVVVTVLSHIQGCYPPGPGWNLGWGIHVVGKVTNLQLHYLLVWTLFSVVFVHVN